MSATTIIATTIIAPTIIAPTVTETVYATIVETPVGPVTLTAVDGALTGLHLADRTHGPVYTSHWVNDASQFRQAEEQLAAYFAGELTEFDLPLRLDGTPWQRRVWQGLIELPYGQTVSYAELARRVGNPKACRAVGLANGRNPVAIIVPCHRVIAADGTLGGYGGGLDRKTWLLGHELAVLRRGAA